MAVIYPEFRDFCEIAADILGTTPEHAFFLTGLFLENNGLPLRGALPDVDVPMVERIAGGQVIQDGIVAWLSERTEHS